MYEARKSAIMRKFDLEARFKSIRKNDRGEHLSGINSKIVGNERDSPGCARTKTLANARRHEIGKVKDELKAMLPILKLTEVERLFLKFYIFKVERNKYNIISSSSNFLEHFVEIQRTQCR